MRRSQLGARLLLAAVALTGSLAVLAGCGGDSTTTPAQTGSARFLLTKMVSDTAAGGGAIVDPDLTNPWGVAFAPGGPFWIADNASGKSTLYDSNGVKQGLIVNLPTPTAATGAAGTGQVYNGTNSFMVSGSPALFLFSTEDGTILAWTANSGANAVLKVDNSQVVYPLPTGPVTGAVYKGLAIGNNNAGNFLFATNFRSGKIDVFDTNFAAANLVGSFTDPNGIPAGFAPFGIQNINGVLYVTYAKQDAAKQDDVAGPGNGLIDVFDTNGTFMKRLVTGSAAGGTVSALNSPWGLTLAPAGFGKFSSDLLVGNFGDGHINAFNPTTGALLGTLLDSANNPIVIPGLWALIFGNGGQGGATGSLFFTAGIGDPPTFTTNVESHGLLGRLQVNTTP
ncbi:MAG: hypothetical protein JWL77_2959 [Chthonomonadaceae bacterium]|nr:hypothetical protein [Chthonomonadaceae bacterium]